MIRIFLLACILLPCIARAEEGAKQWQMRDADSSIKFSVAIEGSPSEGEFTKFTAEIAFDPQQLDHSRIDIIIDLNHIEAFYSDVATNLLKQPWFDTERYPEARFTSSYFKHLGQNNFQVTGDLTLRDVTKSETLYFTATGGSVARRTDRNRACATSRQVEKAWTVASGSSREGCWPTISRNR